ncbi:hypothetical protein CY35_15G074700 [Sphagnum magellanicum]|nr:hypothetical protein CY35_15G074700 [Sphagnum magellanicum]
MTSRHEEKLQATVANGGGGAAAAIRISTQQEANNKTLLHTSSSKKRVSDECNEPQVQPPPRYLMRLLQAAAPNEEEMEKEKKPVQKNTKRHEESAAAVAASSSSSQVGSESKGQGLNPSSSGTPPNFVCQMISTSLPLQAEEKEEIHIDDDDALLPAIAQHSGARNGSTLELDFTTRQIQLQEMGFEEGLITQALRAHGAHADDSILVQFILDLQTNTVNNSIGSNNTEIVIENWQDEDEGEIPNHREEDVFAQDDSSEGERDEVETTLESCSYVPQPEQSIEQMPNKTRTWDRPSSPVNPTEKYTRNQTFLLHQGFDPVLIEKVLVKFGDEDDINQLLDYALALANCDAASISMQNSMPSTSYSVPFQELVEAPAVNTVDKLVNEFKCTFSARAIERALERCETPRLNAKDHQIVALLDFLDAHGDELDQDVEACTMSNPRAKENTDWEDVRHLLAEEGQMSPKTMLPPTYRPPKKAKGLENIEPPEPKRKGAQGFGLPGMTVRRRHLSRDVEGAPFFYFENVATMPKGEWSKIQRHLYDIEPEFYDSLHFSACRRPRGYIHNLPVEGRVKILPDPPMTIQELMPQTQAFWPHWDPRTKFNCINTVKASQPICRKIQENLEVEEPPPDIQRMILKWCKTWNLVWTAPNLPSPISENEIEVLVAQR